MEKPEKHLYIYTIRRARIGGKPKFVGLIPKLFWHAYSDESKEFVFDDYISNIKDELDELKKFNNRDIFSKLLDVPSNFLNKTTYITNEDKIKIKEMNLKFFDYNVSNTNFDSFLEHLYYGHHHDMKYGLYFSLMYAENDIELQKSFKKLKKTNKNDRIVQYIRFDKFLNYIQNIDTINNFNSVILYFNPMWDYGDIHPPTIQIKRNKIDNTLDIESFMKEIKEKYPPNSEMDGELICEIPLDNEIFKFFFIQFGGYKNKYMKYKIKFLALREKLILPY